jgi:predicted amidohydrolase
MPFRVRLGQMTPVLGALHANVEKHLQIIDAAVEDGVDLVVFPELSLTGYYLRDLVPEVAVRLDSPTIAALVERSRKISIAFGFVEETPEYDFHIAAAYLEAGEIRHVHRKVYLPTYGMFDEERYFAAGSRVQSFDTRHGRIAVLVCEDIWHPSAPYIASCDRMHHLIVIANSPVRGALIDRPDNPAIYDMMLGCYAQLLQVNVVFVNRVGYEEGVHFWGGSLALSPTGAVLARAPRSEEACVDATLDLAAVRRARAASPMLSEEKLDLTIRELQRIRRERYGG